MFGFVKKNVYWIIQRLHSRKFWCVITLLLQRTYKMCILNNQTCQARPTSVDINSNEVLFYQFAVFNKCDVNCNTIDDSCSSACATKNVKNIRIIFIIKVNFIKIHTMNTDLIKKKM